jgi:hypothetical protein
VDVQRHLFDLALEARHEDKLEAACIRPLVDYTKQGFHAVYCIAERVDIEHGTKIMLRPIFFQKYQNYISLL